MKREPHVAVLGAGIMGTATALFLARGGARVSLFDAATEPFACASRWNEGKIHLGHLYAADSGLHTARHILPGGLLFKPLTEELIGSSLSNVVTGDDDIYLCHRDSVVGPDAMWDYLQGVTAMVREHPDASNYLVDASQCRTQRLGAAELEQLANPSTVTAGFRVPERSVATTWVADRFVDALEAEVRIEQCMNTRVTAVRPETAGVNAGRWIVRAGENMCGPYDYVVNALWEGRMAIDLTAGISQSGRWSNRYRLALFLRTTEPVAQPSAIVATGPFGDVKNYNGRDFYVSWYPLGLMVNSHEIMPTSPRPLDSSEEPQRSTDILDALAKIIPGVGSIAGKIERMALRGGWVFAAGQGQLSDPEATLHRRTDFGVQTVGNYLSVDTGKYSTAPWLARRIADRILG